jgi:hypothetical protein
MKRALLLAAWTLAVSYFPLLAAVDGLVRPVIVRHEIETVAVESPQSDAAPLRYDDGRTYQGAHCTRGNRRGWWCRGPVRRVLSAPIRFLINR